MRATCLFLESPPGQRATQMSPKTQEINNNYIFWKSGRATPLDRLHHHCRAASQPLWISFTNSKTGPLLADFRGRPYSNISGRIQEMKVKISRAVEKIYVEESNPRPHTKKPKGVTVLLRVLKVGDGVTYVRGGLFCRFSHFFWRIC